MTNVTRRQVLLMSAGAAACLPLALVDGRLARAADMPQLDPDNPQAKALQYTHESPNPDKKCSNCQLYTGEPDAAWGPCSIFPGKQVAAEGYCSSWVAQTG